MAAAPPAALPGPPDWLVNRLHGIAQGIPNQRSFDVELAHRAPQAVDAPPAFPRDVQWTGHPPGNGAAAHCNDRARHLHPPPDQSCADAARMPAPHPPVPNAYPVPAAPIPGLPLRRGRRAPLPSRPGYPLPM